MQKWQIPQVFVKLAKGLPLSMCDFSTGVLRRTYPLIGQ